MKNLVSWYDVLVGYWKVFGIMIEYADMNTDYEQHDNTT